MSLDRSLPSVQNLKHIVVLMMENRSFDHMLGGLKAQYPYVLERSDRLQVRLMARP